MKAEHIGIAGMVLEFVAMFGMLLSPPGSAIPIVVFMGGAVVWIIGAATEIIVEEIRKQKEKL